MEKTNYTIAELFEELINDESWEPDAEKRLATAKAMFLTLNRNIVPLKR
ncbi:MAG: hypothetical protein FWG10_07850 [Eubacteriaceae bacterium]|nr:hypothetical protein [Eubacteriaceae bacterium]